MPTLADLKAALDQATTDATELTTAEESVVSLLGDIKAQLDAALAAGTPQEVIDQVKALSAQLDARTDAMAAAVVANTPSA